MTALKASQLGGEHIGRVIRARVGDETVVQDEITHLAHHQDVTDVAFARIRPQDDHTRLEYATTFRLDHDDEVEVIEA